MSLGDKTVLLRNPWKGETLRINRPAAVKAASLGTHFALGFVTGCVRVFGSCAPFGVAMAARSGGGLGGLACVLGAAAGYLVSGSLAWGLRYMAALVLVFTTAFLLRETAIAHRSWFMPAVAAAVMGATGALNAFDKLLQLPVAVDLATEVVLTGLSAYLFHMALTAERLRLEREELRREAGGVLILCCALMALTRVTIMDVLCLGRVAAVLCVMVSSFGAGAAEGAIDAANILKPALSRGEIQIVGATTLSEYRKHIEKDAAFERRFQPVTVAEPTEDESFQILRGLRDRYEAHHGLKITDEALTAAVKLSARYISDRFLPDKAIDLVDEAASRVRMENLTAPDEMKTIEAKLATLSAQKEEAVRAQDYELAAQLRDRERSERGVLEKARGEWDAERGGHRGAVSAEDIAAVVSGWTGIPVTSLTESESERLLHMEDVLHRRVIGQNEAVAAVARAIRRGRVGLKDPHRPVGSFLFLGPTGVGKTELCRALAEAMFGDENAMIRVDMSEYMEKHTVSKLIGSPPGYVGFDEGGQLTEKVRRKPYSVVLFDEIEKAHEDVWNILLQILEDGVVTDAQGHKVDFRNTAVIMTSNIGAKSITAAGTPLGFAPEEQKSADAQFAAVKAAVIAELRRTFRPEFLNRVDETIVFRRLSREDCAEIARRLLAQTVSRAAALGITLEADEDCAVSLAERGYDVSYGARPLRRLIRSEVEDALATCLLDGTLASGDTAVLAAENGTLCVRRREKAAAAALGDVGAQKA